MSDDIPEAGPDDDERPGPAAPLSDTFPEFIRYARKRRQKGPRQAPPGDSAPGPTPRQSLLAVVAIVFFLSGMLAYRFADSALPHPPAPAWVTHQHLKASTWINLPRPRTMGQAPESWGNLAIGQRKADIDPARLTEYTLPDHWADQIYTPDPSHPEAFFGVSFYSERVFRISLKLAGEPGVSAASTLAMARVAYGPARGYEYLTPGETHSVTIFQTESRALKFDSVRLAETSVLSEVTLVELDWGAARELERARHGR